MSEPFVKDQAHRERIEKGEAILPSYPATETVLSRRERAEMIWAVLKSYMLDECSLECAAISPADEKNLVNEIYNSIPEPVGVAQAGKEPDTERQRELHAREIDAHIADITGQLFDALNEISRLRAGLKSIVDLQNPLPRAAVREACSEILRASPLPSTLRQCPICVRRVASPCETLAIATSCPLSSTHREAGK